MSASFRSRFVDGLVALDASESRKRLAAVLHEADSSASIEVHSTLLAVRAEMRAAPQRWIERLADALDAAAARAIPPADVADDDLVFGEAEEDARLASEYPEPSLSPPPSDEDAAPPAPVIPLWRPWLPPVKRPTPTVRPAPTVKATPAPAPEAAPSPAEEPRKPLATLRPPPAYAPCRIS